MAGASVLRRIFWIACFVLLNIACWMYARLPVDKWMAEAELLPDEPSSPSPKNEVRTQGAATEQPARDVEKKKASNHSVSLAVRYPLKNYNPLFRQSPYRDLDLVRAHSLIAPDRLNNAFSSTTHPFQRAVVCMCGKCGSTSFFNMLYQQIFDQPFKGPKNVYVQETDSEPWKGVFQKRLNVSNAKEILSHPKTFSFAIIREPISRLISAWKSKLACDDKRWKTEIGARWFLMQGLLELSGMPIPKRFQGLNLKESKDQYCLEFPEYVEALRLVYSRGKQDELNGHFNPQHLHCFRTTKPTDWTHIVVASDPSIAPIFANLLGLKNENVTMPHSRQTAGNILEISDNEVAILESITADERAIINPLLLALKNT